MYKVYIFGNETIPTAEFKFLSDAANFVNKLGDKPFKVTRIVEEDITEKIKNSIKDWELNDN